MMARLDGRWVLIVEDEYFLASELAYCVEDAGARVLGPAVDLTEAFDHIHQAPRLDLAVLDINLCGNFVYPVADLLAEWRVPFVFTTGYDRGGTPERFRDIPLCQKPVDAQMVIRALARALVMPAASNDCAS